MNNRVDYLSDRLVNLRGKHKSVDEVIPPDSIANGVSVRPAEKPGKNSSASLQSAISAAQERRREQTVQLYSDFEQRLLRRSKQSQLKAAELAQKCERLQQLHMVLDKFREQLTTLQLQDDETLSPALLGERYRAIDRMRLEFFETESELEMLLDNTGAVAVEPALPERESFKMLLKKGAAWALTAGLTIAAAILIGALILFAAWS